MTAPKASRQRVAVSRMLYSSDCARLALVDAARGARLARDFGVAAVFERRPAADIRALFDASPRKPLQAPDQLAEALPTGFKVGELVEAGAAGREQHHLTVDGRGSGERKRMVEITAHV